VAKGGFDKSMIRAHALRHYFAIYSLRNGAKVGHIQNFEAQFSWYYAGYFQFPYFFFSLGFLGFFTFFLPLVPISFLSPF